VDDAAENKRLRRLMRRNIMEARAEWLQSKKRAGRPDVRFKLTGGRLEAKIDEFIDSIIGSANDGR
jgi:hypothetical protein